MVWPSLVVYGLAPRHNLPVGTADHDKSNEEPGVAQHASIAAPSDTQESGNHTDPPCKTTARLFWHDDCAGPSFRCRWAWDPRAESQSTQRAGGTRQVWSDRPPDRQRPCAGFRFKSWEVMPAWELCRKAHGRFATNATTFVANQQRLAHGPLKGASSFNL